MDVWVGWSRSDAPAEAESLLSPAERSRLEGFVNADERARFLSAHVLVRLLVAQVVDAPPDAVAVVQRCPRCGRAHGRPVAMVGGSPGPAISLAHAGALVVAAVSDVPVGVDVEPMGGEHPGVDDVALTAGERRLLATLPPAARSAALLRWWVRKEAVLKATGHGLDVDPSRLEISPPDQPPLLLGWEGDGAPATVTLADLDLADDHTAAVAALVDPPLRVLSAALPLSGRRW